MSSVNNEEKRPGLFKPGDMHKHALNKMWDNQIAKAQKTVQKAQPQNLGKQVSQQSQKSK